MAQTLTTFDAVLKDWYEGPIRDQLNSEILLVRELNKRDSVFVGRQVVIPINLRRNEGVGARGDGGTLPAAQNQVYQSARIRATYNYGRVEVSGPTIRASQGARGAFAEAISSEIKGMMRDLKNDINRQLYSDGSGALAVVAVAPAGAAAVDHFIDTDAGQAGAPGNRFFRNNMLIDYIDPIARTVRQAALRVVGRTGRDVVNYNVGAVALVNDIAVRSGSLDNELDGLSAAVNDAGIYLSIDRALFPEWRATVLNNPAGAGTARALTLPLMQQAIDTASERSGRDVDMIVAHYTIRQSYLNLLTPDVRFVATDLRGGFKTLSYAGGKDEIPVWFDKDCQYNTAWFLCRDSFRLYRQLDFTWADEDGSILNRVPDSDSFEAFLKYYANLGCEQPNANVRLNDITPATTPIVP